MTLAMTLAPDASVARTIFLSYDQAARNDTPALRSWRRIAAARLARLPDGQNGR